MFFAKLGSVQSVQRSSQGMYEIWHCEKRPLHSNSTKLCHTMLWTVERLNIVI